jgi:hypothetical protein
MNLDDEPEPAPLRADARRMLATWREADAMPRAVKGRVWKRLHRPTRVQAPRRDTAWVLAVAIAAAVLLVWWGVANVWRAAIDDGAPRIEQSVDHRDAPADERSVVEPQRTVQPPVVAPTPAPRPTIAPPVQTPTASERSALESPARPRSVAPPREEAPAVDTATTTLARERDLIARAWSALAHGDPASALERAAEHEQAFPEGLLAPERRAIAVIARCKRGDRDAGTAAQAWIAAQPRSPLVKRVRVACE